MGVEVEVLQQGATGFDARRLAGADLLVDVQERLILGGDLAVLARAEVRAGKSANSLRISDSSYAQGQQEDGDVLLALAVDAHRDTVGLVDLELEPGTARGDELDVVDVLVRRLLGGALEVHARGAHELGHDARSEPLTMKVPLSVMSGKSPMKTVWDLISPVEKFSKSATT